MASLSKLLLLLLQQGGQAYEGCKDMLLLLLQQGLGGET